MKSILVILSAIILQVISGYSTHEYQRYVAKNVNGFATVEGVVSKDGVTKKFYKVIPEYSSTDSIPTGTNEFVFPDPIKMPEIKIPEFTSFQQPIQIPTPKWNSFSVDDHVNKITKDILEQNKKIHESINSNFLNSFSSQPTFRNTFPSQPTFGNKLSSQPLFGNTFSSKPKSFGSTFSSQPNFYFTQPSFASGYSTYPGFGNTFAAQPDFNDFTPEFSFENAGNSFYFPEYPQINYWL